MGLFGLYLKVQLNYSFFFCYSIYLLSKPHVLFSLLTKKAYFPVYVDYCFHAANHTASLIAHTVFP